MPGQLLRFSRNAMLSALREVVKDLYPSAGYVYTKILIELACNLIEQGSADERMADERESHAKLVVMLRGNSDMWADIDQVLEHANNSLARHPDDGKQMDRWNCPTTSNLDGKKDCDISARLEDLSLCVKTYLATHWADSPSLELWLTRQMIFAETYAFGREANLPIEIKSINFWWEWSKSLVKWAIGVLAAFSIGETYGAAIGVMTYGFWLCAVRYLMNDKLANLAKINAALTQMRLCHVLASRSQPCPTELMDAMKRSEDVLTVWPDGLRGLMQHVVLRRTGLWQ